MKILIFLAQIFGPRAPIQGAYTTAGEYFRSGSLKSYHFVVNNRRTTLLRSSKQYGPQNRNTNTTFIDILIKLRDKTVRWTVIPLLEGLVTSDRMTVIWEASNTVGGP